MEAEGLTLYRARTVEGVFDPDVERVLVPLSHPVCVERPAVLIVRRISTELLDLAAADASVAALVVVDSLDALDSPTVDPRVDDIVTPRADLEELLMRGRRALARKREVSEPRGPEVTVEGVRWRDVCVPLSSTEARIAERLLRSPGIVVPDADLRALDESGIPMTRRALDTHIYRLRKKLQPVSCITIQSVRQRGFRADVHPLR